RGCATTCSGRAPADRKDPMTSQDPATVPTDRDSFRAWVRATIHAGLPDGWSGLGGLPDDEIGPFVERWRLHLGAHGLLAPGWPPEHGGLGLDVARQVVVQEELARVGAPPGSGNDPFSIE